jgi:hypothetical protein
MFRKPNKATINRNHTILFIGTHTFDSRLYLDSSSSFKFPKCSAMFSLICIYLRLVGFFFLGEVGGGVEINDWVTRISLKARCEHRPSGRISSSCSTSGNRRVTLLTNSVISHEWGKGKTTEQDVWLLVAERPGLIFIGYSEQEHVQQCLETTSKMREGWTNCGNDFWLPLEEYGELSRDEHYSRLNEYNTPPILWNHKRMWQV